MIVELIISDEFVLEPKDMEDRVAIAQRLAADKYEMRVMGEHLILSVQSTIEGPFYIQRNTGCLLARLTLQCLAWRVTPG
jgi:hypothetical protein